MIFRFLLATLASLYVSFVLIGSDLPPVYFVRRKAIDRLIIRFGHSWAGGLACYWCAGFWVSCCVVSLTWWRASLPLPGLWYLAVPAVVGLVGSKVI